MWHCYRRQTLRILIPTVVSISDTEQFYSALKSYPDAAPNPLFVLANATIKNLHDRQKCPWIIPEFLEFPMLPPKGRRCKPGHPHSPKSLLKRPTPPPMLSAKVRPGELERIGGINVTALSRALRVIQRDHVFGDRGPTIGILAHLRGSTDLSHADPLWLGSGQLPWGTEIPLVATLLKPAQFLKSMKSIWYVPFSLDIGTYDPHL
jgi:hypothetical protein